MPFYCCTIIYRAGQKGFTETYYRAATSARAASDFGGPAGLEPWRYFRSSSTILQAVRAQEETGLRRMYLRLHYAPGNKLQVAPETPGIAAKLHIPFAGGGHRGLEFRGLDDAAVRRDATGRDDPGPGFVQGLERLRQRFGELDLCGRRLIPHPKHTVLWYGLHPESPQLTLVQLRGQDFRPEPGSYVDCGGTTHLAELERGHGYLVVASEPGWVSLYHPWPNVRDVRPEGKNVWVRQLEYEYPSFEALQFAGFGSYTTGPAYRPLSWAVDSPWRAPLSPCGRIVDFARATHRVDMAFFRYDTSLALPVRWYYPEVIPGAAPGQPATVEEIPAVPYEHPFGSRLWELAGDFLPSLGERRERHKYSGRAPALLRGIGLCGSRDAWENGAGLGDKAKPINESTGQPCCCGPGAILMSGGAAAGGAVPAATRIVGGAAGGGRVDLVHEVLGGAAGGGRVEIIPVPSYLPSGGIVVGGAGLVQLVPGPPLLVVVPTGGVVVGRGSIPPRHFLCTACPDGAYHRYKVIIAGATGGHVAQNGTHVVTYNGYCSWHGEIDGVTLDLVITASGIASLWVTVGLGGDWTYHFTDFPLGCDGPWDLPVSGTEPEMPATITVEHF